MNGENTAAGIQFALSVAPAIIQGTENALPEGGNGGDKHSVARGALVTIATGVEAGVAAANPAYAAVISLLDLVIRSIIKARAAKGNPVKPSATGLLPFGNQTLTDSINVQKLSELSPSRIPAPTVGVIQGLTDGIR